MNLTFRDVSGQPTETSATDQIFVRDFVLDAEIGVFAHEKGRRQRMRFNVEADVPRPARVSDDVADIVSYDIIIEAIRRAATSGHVKLVETMAERIAADTLADARVSRVKVRVEKLDVIEGSVGVEIERIKSASLQK
jgi:(5-formylfuran-3-yl)methyl phosphate synthase